MKITVIVAAHKKYRMPEESCYLPLHVGKAAKEDIGFQGDDSGENISKKNPYYCELTGLYWMWKNIDSDYVGLVHYRRYLGSTRGGKDPYSRILTEQDILSYMEKTDIILPKKRNYFIESVYEHYAHTHYREHLDITREIIREQCPVYLKSFDKVMRRSSAHMFNMFVMKRERCDEYCSWLFAILQQLEQQLDLESYDAFQARLFGRISELLLDVWIEKNQYRYVEVPLIYMEKKKTARKTVSFLFSKIFGRKYSKSM